jgi:hypothetical protein
MIRTADQCPLVRGTTWSPHVATCNTRQRPLKFSFVTPKDFCNKICQKLTLRVPGIAIERDGTLAIDLLGFSLAEQPTFGPLGAARFRSTNRRRNGFHRVAPAALEDAVLESSHAGVYTLQIHAFATRRAPRTFGRQQLR